MKAQMSFRDSEKSVNLNNKHYTCWNFLENIFLGVYMVDSKPNKFAQNLAKL